MMEFVSSTFRTKFGISRLKPFHLGPWNLGSASASILEYSMGRSLHVGPGQAQAVYVITINILGRPDRDGALYVIMVEL